MPRVWSLPEIDESEATKWAKWAKCRALAWYLFFRPCHGAWHHSISMCIVACPSVSSLNLLLHWCIPHSFTLELKPSSGKPDANMSALGWKLKNWVPTWYPQKRVRQLHCWCWNHWNPSGDRWVFLGNTLNTWNPVWLAFQGGMGWSICSTHIYIYIYIVSDQNTLFAFWTKSFQISFFADPKTILW